MEPKQVIHFLHVPWTGLGLYDGFRGNRWLRNRITIFKQFVVPALLRQTDRDFILWCAWRYEERGNQQVIDLKQYLDAIGLRNVFTYSGVCFWDDKYPDSVAYERLVSSVRDSMGDLLNAMRDEDEVLMTIQPSDDIYHTTFVADTKAFFVEHKDVHVFGYRYGYVMDYLSGKLCEWNPQTTPPFYTIRFPRETFIEPLKHVLYTGPYKSHEYVKDYLPAQYMGAVRGFIVGTHGENISTVFDHPYAGKEFHGESRATILKQFGLSPTARLTLPKSLRRTLFMKMPYAMKRKLRYLAGEKQWLLRPVFASFYDFIRN